MCFLKLILSVDFELIVGTLSNINVRKTTNFNTRACYVVAYLDSYVIYMACILYRELTFSFFLIRVVARNDSQKNQLLFATRSEDNGVMAYGVHLVSNFR